MTDRHEESWVVVEAIQNMREFENLTGRLLSINRSTKYTKDNTIMQSEDKRRIESITNPNPWFSPHLIIISIQIKGRYQ